MAKYDYFDIKEKQGEFLNPYTFVDVNFEKNPLMKDRTEKGTLTGVISCSMKTVTPIAILDTVNRTESKNCSEHYEYPFMRDEEGKCMIPGSSIRGIVRNVYEALTDSCFPTHRDEEGLSNRVEAKPSEVFLPGVLKQEGKEWVLYPQTRYPLKDAKIQLEKSGDKKGERYVELGNKRFFSGDIISIMLKDEQMRNGRTRKIANLDSKSPKTGMLVIGENTENCNKKFESVFVDNPKEAPIRLTNLEMEALKKNIDIYRKNAIKSGEREEFYPAYGRLKKEGRIPIWYRKRGDKTYLSPAAIGRVVSHKTLGQLVNKKRPCTTRDCLCLACSLFGMIGEKSTGSRVRFSDALSTQNNEVTKCTLVELGTPHITYMPFYSIGGNREGFGYDTGAKIRGRKFYWHSDNWKNINKKAVPNKLNSTVEVVGDKNTAKFNFNVFFENITEKELEQLIFSLNLGENDKDGLRCHKIGHGKPVGLGSVKITVDDVKVRDFGINKGYAISSMMDELFDAEGIYKKNADDIFVGRSTVEQVIKVCTFSANEYLCYPYIVINDSIRPEPKENEVASHIWYKNNTKPLPRISDAVQTMYLKKIHISENNKGNNRPGNGYGKPNYGGNRNNYGYNKNRRQE